MPFPPGQLRPFNVAARQPRSLPRANNRREVTWRFGQAADGASAAPGPLAILDATLAQVGWPRPTAQGT
eukprot:300465-Lingulodinium_polyedra.AAC.1